MLKKTKRSMKDQTVEELENQLFMEEELINLYDNCAVNSNRASKLKKSITTLRRFTNYYVNQNKLIIEPEKSEHCALYTAFALFYANEFSAEQENDEFGFHQDNTFSSILDKLTQSEKSKILDDARIFKYGVNSIFDHNVIAEYFKNTLHNKKIEDVNCAAYSYSTIDQEIYSITVSTNNDMKIYLEVELDWNDNDEIADYKFNNPLCSSYFEYLQRNFNLKKMVNEISEATWGHENIELLKLK